MISSRSTVKAIRRRTNWVEGCGMGSLYRTAEYVLGSNHNVDRNTTNLDNMETLWTTTRSFIKREARRGHMRLSICRISKIQIMIVHQKENATLDIQHSFTRSQLLFLRIDKMSFLNKIFTLGKSHNSKMTFLICKTQFKKILSIILIQAKRRLKAISLIQIKRVHHQKDIALDLMNIILRKRNH